VKLGTDRDHTFVEREPDVFDVEVRGQQVREDTLERELEDAGKGETQPHREH